MKVFHIITSLKIGGAESALVNFLCHTVQIHEHEHVVIYFHEGLNVKKIEALGIKTYRINMFAFWRLFYLIKKIKPDIIHSALWSANIIGRVFARIFKIPIICDVHGNSFDEGKLRNFFDRITVNWATNIVAVSLSTGDDYRKNIKDTQKISIINNGIDFMAVRAAANQNQLTRAKFGLTSTDFVVGAIGRLEPIKSYDLLIRACEHLPIKLMIIGGGSQIQPIKKLIIDLKLSDNIILTGARTDAISFYPLFDCFALSSHSEGLSIALLEALCFGLPIITTNQTKKHDVITHGVNGLIVPPNNIYALKEALLTIINNPKQRILMQKNNKLLVEKKFSLANTVNLYNKIYNKIYML